MNFKSLLARYKADPGQLTDDERTFVRAELDRIARRGKRKSSPGYATEKARARERSAARTLAGTDIAPVPEVVNPARRAAAAASYQVWNETYFPNRFYLRWSPDQLQVQARIQEAVDFGGLFALAMPRSGGKTNLSETAILWAGMTARHLFAMLLAVNATRAVELLESVKTELLTNDLLLEDWPEVCYPVRRLEGRANRSKGQHVGGALTHIAWRRNEVVFPVVAGSPASAIILRVSGLTGGGIRGQKYTRPQDGKSVRPSFVILDDPQDDAVANSAYQVEQRHQLVHGAVLGMAGPGKKITAIMPCTIIRPDDLSHQLLDREKSPLWTGQRYQLLPRFPERMDLWDEYATRRNDEFRNGGDGHLATAWYGQQKELMDRGAIASWPERHNPDELSALQHAMNLYYLNRQSFMAEYQNDPLPVMLGDGDQLTSDALLKRTNGIPRGVVPQGATKLSGFIDVQKQVLYYAVCAWSEGFGGAVIDYGAYPDQGRAYFTLADVQRTLGRACPGAGLQGAIHAGLEKLGELLLAREWKREDGALMKVERLLVDANWGESADTVYNWCRRTPHAAVTMPSHGKFVGPASKPWSQYQKKPGEVLGTHWMIPAIQSKRVGRHVLVDVGWWKSFLAERLTAKVGDRSALTFFGGKGEDHRMLVDHLTSEYRARMTEEKTGVVVDVWRQHPARPDNHMLDVLTGAAAAASMLGITLPTAQGQDPPKARRTTNAADFARKQAEFRSRRGY